MNIITTIFLQVKQLTGDKMEIDDESECDINMRSVLVAKPKPFTSSYIDVVIHNTPAIRSNKE